MSNSCSPAIEGLKTKLILSEKQLECVFSTYRDANNVLTCAENIGSCQSKLADCKETLSKFILIIDQILQEINEIQKNNFTT